MKLRRSMIIGLRLRSASSFLLISPFPCFNFYFQTVRGAYMHQERQISADTGSPDPIHGTYCSSLLPSSLLLDTFEDTSTSYNKDGVAFFMSKMAAVLQISSLRL